MAPDCSEVFWGSGAGGGTGGIDSQVFALGDEVVGHLLDLIRRQRRFGPGRRHIVHRGKADFRAARQKTGQTRGEQGSERKLRTMLLLNHARFPDSPPTSR